LPQNLIADFPANPRDSARLLIYKRETKEIIHSVFSNLFDFLPQNIAILLNDTKVVKARIFGEKITGGRIELLLNSPLQDNCYSVYIRGKVSLGSELFFEKNLKAIVKSLEKDGTRVVEFFQNNIKIDTASLFSILNEIGHIPLPPYIKREDTKQDTKEYQSVFSKYEGAVAAPTASLHFSDTMFQTLKQKYEHGFLTLHVGAGTFKPVEADNILDHKMHSEFYTIPESTCNLIDSEKNILAVGTTVTRTVEYYVRKHLQSGYSNLFLHPLNRPKRVNHLLTNFHLPKSTLIMLVASFIGLEETLRIYETAVAKKYRFFSYGDAMLIV
jgi:S-adenosylmethionine:tRNA ribosyltransferase-isomerase